MDFESSPNVWICDTTAYKLPLLSILKGTTCEFSFRTAFQSELYIIIVIQLSRLKLPINDEWCLIFCDAWILEFKLLEIQIVLYGKLFATNLGPVQMRVAYALYSNLCKSVLSLEGNFWKSFK